MKTLAAILVETGRPLLLTKLDIPPLKSGQVLVEIAFSGVCHTQILEWRGYRGKDPYLPHCLGHEGSGIVRELGPDITKVRSGDRVLLSWLKGSGASVPGTVYKWGERNVNAGGITTFMRYAIISEDRLTVMPTEISMQDAALLGCAAATGLGTVFNTAKAMSGQSLVVFGCGGIGLCAVAGAAIADCMPIIAVDVLGKKLSLASHMGATHLIDAQKADPPATILSLCPGGADIAIEATGRPEVMNQTLASVRAQGGKAIIAGNARHDERIDLDPRQLNMGKSLLGTWGGETQPDRDFPRYCDLVSSGKLNLDLLVSKKYLLNDINQAFKDLEQGKVARPLITMQEG